MNVQCTTSDYIIYGVLLTSTNKHRSEVIDLSFRTGNPWRGVYANQIIGWVVTMGIIGGNHVNEEANFQWTIEGSFNYETLLKL